MQDRFRFRVWSKKYNKFIEDNRYPIGSDYQLIITQSGTLIKLGLGDFEDDCEDSYSWATFNDYEQDCIVMQCTGLKDNNGKLIYEGDIVKYAEFDWTDFSFKDWETKIAQVVWGNTYDNYYPAFDLKDTDFDGTNAFAYLFNEGWTVEVIGNVYQNPELLED